MAETLQKENRDDAADLMTEAGLNKCPDCCLVPTCNACGPCCEHDDEDEYEAVQAWLCSFATVDKADRVILGSELPADEAGWSRDACWYGNEIGGDEAITCSWSNRYHGPDGQTADVDYYVYGEPSRGYGVVECVDTFTVDDEGDRSDDEGEQSDNGLAPSFDSPAAALAYARSCAMIDSRWWFSL